MIPWVQILAVLLIIGSGSFISFQIITFFENRSKWLQWSACVIALGMAYYLNTH
jgi:hypothetical protein